jgi:hypothetical protein
MPILAKAGQHLGLWIEFQASPATSGPPAVVYFKSTISAFSLVKALLIFVPGPRRQTCHIRALRSGSIGVAG